LPIVVESLRDHVRAIIGWSLGLVVLVAVQMSVYPTIRDSSEGWSSLTEQFPEVFKEVFRIADYTSEVGYLSAELFSFVVPFMFIAIGATWGARLATEDEDRGMADIVLALPVERRDYVASRLVAAAVALVASAVSFLAALVVGARALDMAIPVSRFAVATGMLVLIGLVFLALAAVIGAWTARRAVALGFSTGAAIAMFIAYSLAPLVGWLDATSPVNPMTWTIGSQSLVDGLDTGLSLRTLAVAAALTLATFPVFGRRDISA
jgi:ABC-2 type transport system permease protein